jgi:purine-binding chemotaxis protein CheW
MAEERSRPIADDARLFSERAAVLARPLAAGKAESVRDIVVVRVGTEHIGLPSELVWGVFDDVRFVQVPGAPRWIAGLALVRGELVSVVHFSHWLGAPRASESRTIVVLSDERGLLGVVVDEVLGFRDIQSDELSQELSAKTSGETLPFGAVTKDLVSIVDVARFFGDPRLIVDHRGTPQV